MEAVRMESETARTVLTGSALQEEVDALGSHLSSLVERHPGRLAVLWYELPDEVDGTEFRRRLQARMSRSGLDFVDVQLSAGNGPIRLVAAEFEPW